MNEIINSVFGPPLKALFHPINDFLMGVYMPWARIFALALFIGAMIWVFTLRKQYVNLDGPGKWWSDLRVWTVVSMIPHLIVYFYF